MRPRTLVHSGSRFRQTDQSVHEVRCFMAYEENGHGAGPAPARDDGGPRLGQGSPNRRADAGRRPLPRAAAGTVTALTVLALGAALGACGPLDDRDAAGDAPPAGIDPGLDELGGVPQRIAPSTVPSDAPSPPLPSARPKPPSASDPAFTAPPERRPGPSYEAWAGPGCTGGGRYEEEGRYDDGDEGWYTVRSGGHRGDGCDGRFTAIPMSGARDEDSGGRATWTWYVGGGYRTCTVAVVVPGSERAEDVAGQPSTYRVLSDPGDPDSAVRIFEIDQTRLRGEGVVVERVPVHDQRLTVQLVDRGQDWGRDRGRDRKGAHHAAAQMRAECGG